VKGAREERRKKQKEKERKGEREKERKRKSERERERERERDVHVHISLFASTQNVHEQHRLRHALVKFLKRNLYGPFIEYIY